MKPLCIVINRQPVTVAAHSTILEAATAAGIEIPTLCYNKTLDVTGSCWMCIVEIKGKELFVPACNTRVTEGMVVETENEMLHSMRRQNLQRIIEQHSGDCMGPCELSCPAGCNIPDFVSAIASRENDQAIKIIKESIPLPGILGRICPAPCEDECRRHGVDQPLSICALKRHAADRESENAVRFIPERAAATGKKVAVIGSGPAGLSAAYFLLVRGHGVTVFEAAPEAGGMMRYGIPRFRLPESVIESDIAPLREMGGEFRFNTAFGRQITIKDMQEGFDALFLAFGAQKASTMNIAGEDAAHVFSGIEFLRRAATGNQPHPGERVIVTGGGNTAIDAARTALRLGAANVTILYRRSKEDMPANSAEIREAIAEGITIIEHAAPTAITTLNGALSITAVTMQPGEPDSSGRRRAVPVVGTEFTIEADTIISAIGQQLDPLAAIAAGIATGKGGTLQVDPDTLQTEFPWIFAGGDCVTGTDLAIRAVEQGKRAARSIDRFLGGESVAAASPSFNSSFGARDEAPEAFYQKKPSAPRVPLEELSAEQRIKSFEEVVSGYSEEAAVEEAMRCLQCRCNALEDCRLRELANRYLPIRTTEKHAHPGFYKAVTADIIMEREKCVDCGICVRKLEQLGEEEEISSALMAQNCPTGAISRA